jgi:diguanylate cyclase (GGDEF)-like protein
MPIKFIGRRDGLPSAQVLGLTLGPDGCIWAATVAGLVYHDGARTLVYTREHGLSSHGIRCVATRPDGRIWVGSDVGIDVFFNGGTEPLAQKWQYGFVESLLCVAEKTWLGTAKGLVLHDGDQFSLLTDVPFAGRTINAISQLDDGTIWVAPAGGGLFFYRDDRWHTFDAEMMREVGEIGCLAPGPRNSIFAGGSGGFGGFTGVGSSGETLFWKEAKNTSHRVRGLHYSAGELWLATSNQLELYVFHKRKWQLSSVVLKKVLVDNFLQDGLGNIWLATASHGIGKISILRKAIQRIELPDTQSVYAIALGLKGRLIVGGGEASYWIAPDDKDSIRPISALRHKQVWDVLQIPSGTMFAATDGGLLVIEENREPYIVGADQAELSRPNRCLLFRDNKLLVGTTGGAVTVSEDLSVAPLITENNESLGYVYTMVFDHNDRLWVGTLGKGLWYEENGELRSLATGGLIDTGNTYAIDVREDNTIAVVQDESIFIISPDMSIRLLTRSDEAIAAWTIRWANDGSLWIGSTNGLAQLNSEDGREQRRVTAFLDLSDWEFMASRSLYFEDGDVMYCGLNSGLVKVDKKALEDFKQAPKVKIFEINWVKTEPKIVDDVYVVESGRWSLDVRVFSAWFIDEDEVFYQFRLLGFDETWGEPTRRPRVTFNSLPPGYYQLEVRAQNRLTGVGPIRSVMAIEVLPPNWANSWLMSGLKYFQALRRINNAMFRNRQLNERTRQLEREIEERTADLEQAKMQLESSNAVLTNQSITDALTGVGNRRHFDDVLATAIGSATINQTPLSLILLDIDYFKPYNDTYGHTKGDDCLIAVSQALASGMFRSTDLLARYGGEEFAVILGGVEKKDAMMMAERLRSLVEAAAIPHSSSSIADVVTISVGVTTILYGSMGGNNRITAQLLIDSADDALYAAKEGGRNRCEFKEF